MGEARRVLAKIGKSGNHVSKRMNLLLKLLADFKLMTNSEIIS